MGEYIFLDGKQYMIGTLYDMYYCRVDDLRRWIAAGRANTAEGNKAPASFLKPEMGNRFRFPFPDEDWRKGDGIGDRTKYRIHDRGYIVPVSLEIGRFFDDAHGRMCKVCDPIGQAGPGINVFTPCPQAPTFDLDHSPFPQRYMIQITQQKFVGAQLWTVARCAYCGGAIGLPQDEAGQLVEYIQKMYAHDPALVEIAARILAGYS